MKSVSTITRRMTRHAVALIALIFALAAPTTATALPDFRLTLLDSGTWGAFNVVAMSLSNISTGGENITDFSLTIGATNWEFDYVRELSQTAPYNSFPAGATGASLVTGDMGNGGAGTDQFELAFSDFNPGETLELLVDLDADSGWPFVDARQVLFNNAGEPNAIITVQYDTGPSVAVALADLDQNGLGFTFTSTTSGVSMVPEPNSALLLGLGLFGLSLYARRHAR